MESPSFKGIVDAVEFIQDPKIENLPPREAVPLRGNCPNIKRQDIQFINNVRDRHRWEPDVLRRVVQMPVKLNHDEKLAPEEARELIQQLECNSFPHNNLDLSGYRFENLFLGNNSYNQKEVLVCGGDLNLSDVVVEGHFEFNGRIGGDLIARRMKIFGSTEQSFEIGGNCIQDEYFIGGNNFQSGSISGFNNQFRARIMGKNMQRNLKVGGNNEQNFVAVGRSNDQSGMQIHGDNEQYAMEVAGNNVQWRMGIAGCNQQRNMKIAGHNEQVKLCVLKDNQQDHMSVQGANHQCGLYVGGANSQAHMQVGEKNVRENVEIIGSDFKSGMKESEKCCPACEANGPKPLYYTD
ncbi:hypothetical protein COV82_03095 [Candidatus Peregrinibacteria bacterium CG11_big_fil_rev_8_21_14_0_20_46_8]|nr:MAG: hypothetical protein COV82_03095 [Candidatus Peregrinibacteria bacterium CG11_big_fil_rev_8_21_14_0_20_46_8]